MAFKLNTLHIFGYGETQVIGQNDGVNVKQKSTQQCAYILATSY